MTGQRLTMTPLGNLHTGNSARITFGAGAALAVFIFLEALVALQAWLAFRDHFLTVSQMQGRGVNLGLPFAWHFGMWGDVFIVSPLAAYVMGRFSSTWRLRWILLSLALGIAAAIAMSWSYTLPDFQEAHVQGHSLTPAGAVHVVYMALALAVFTQFLFFTESVSSRLLLVASVLLVVQVFLGTHMALGLLHLAMPLDWYPAQPLKSTIGWSIIVTVAGGLIWRNAGNARLYNAVVLVYMFLTLEDPRPVEGHLKLLNRVSDLSIATTYFFKLSELPRRSLTNILLESLTRLFMLNSKPILVVGTFSFVAICAVLLGLAQTPRSFSGGQHGAEEGGGAIQKHSGAQGHPS